METRREKGEGRREKGEGRREKGEGREKGEERREKGEEREKSFLHFGSRVINDLWTKQDCRLRVVSGTENVSLKRPVC